jgi:iron complex transport system permease protein
MLATGVVLLLSRMRGTRSETIILIGVALGSLFSAGLMFLQYMVDDTRLAAIVYWTFGDTARSTWTGLMVMTLGVIPISAYFVWQSWNYNALIFGEETALGLGVPVRRLQILTMLFSSLLTAILVSLLGIIGFVGLVVPHLARLLIGSDYRFLLPFSLLFGGLLLLLADTAARLILAPRILPVSILTAFIGVPVFLPLLLGKRGGGC